jgi:isoleucyl-tRNA synthetase
VTCVGSLAELSELAGRDLTGLDPHRPFVDGITFICPACDGGDGGDGGDGLARRVPEVIDVWYDSGAMPFAQHGAPLRNAEEFSASYPAQFICEALDQTRGWFYSLMVVGTLVFGRSAYENVVCVGLLVDESGRKMSKHLGNVLEPLPLMEAHGADALRWFFAASGSPWGARRVGPDVLAEIVRKILLTYWNTTSFLVLYANAGGWTASGLGSAPAVGQRPLIDRWMLSELHATVRDVTESLEAFDTAAAGRRLAVLIDDLSNWYVRRSRRRFWDGPSSPDGAAAFATLYECVRSLTLLMAPITPFLTDYIWAVLRSSDAAPQSVHLASWPVADPALIDPVLSAQMALTRRLVDLGRSARSGASVRTRQPLSRALIGAPGFADLPDELAAQIAAELNVASLGILGESGGEPGELVDYEVKPNFRSLGRRFGRRTPAVAAAITAVPAADIATAVLAGQMTAVPVPGPGEPEAAIGADDVIVTQTPRTGWAVATDAGETVAIDTTVTAELHREGLAREVIRLVQDARKNDGLDITDRILLRWSANDPELAAAMTEHAGLIAREVLAVDYRPGAADPDMFEHADRNLGVTFWLRRA